MATFFTGLRGILAVGALIVFAAVAVPAAAQQPTSVNPTASSVKEEQLLRELQQVQGRITIPDAKASVLIQPEGREWRRFSQVTLRWVGGIAIVGILLALVVFYLWRGMVRLESGFSGRTIVRFNAFERFVHWTTALCFIILALTGLNITFGKVLLLPLLGLEAFSAWSQWAKYSHNYLSFPFTIGVVVIFLMWFVGNIPNRVDVRWVKEGFGGIVDRGKHPPAERFNAGQKLMYWVVVIGGAIVAVTGYLLMFPFYATGVDGMQWAQIVHGIVSVLFIAIMLAHIYIGTIGMEGAFWAMGTGEVDVNWAKEHHRLWLERQAAGTAASEAQRRAAATPAE